MRIPEGDSTRSNGIKFIQHTVTTCLLLFYINKQICTYNRYTSKSHYKIIISEQQWYKSKIYWNFVYIKLKSISFLFIRQGYVSIFYYYDIVTNKISKYV